MSIMKKFMFVRTIVVEAEDEDDAWEKLPEEIDNNYEDISDNWAIDELFDEGE